ncbi:hypothetical protein [Desulfitobacterium hafniense]|uniref:hypothetical protein n=1 Tax=Desulfitobacterium hafniense TaxID=49338 RepID=UPI001FA704DE|nr:hypothetical protein [Desulfitobacterium hafniense]
MKGLKITGLKKFDVNIKGVYYILKEAWDMMLNIPKGLIAAMMKHWDGGQTLERKLNSLVDAHKSTFSLVWDRHVHSPAVFSGLFRFYIGAAESSDGYLRTKL